MHQVSDIWSGGGASLLLMSFLFYLFLECRILDDGFVNSKTMFFFLVEIQKQCYVILIAWVLKKNRPGPIQPSNQLLQTKTLKSNAGFDCFNHGYVTGDERLGLILRVFKL